MLTCSNCSHTMHKRFFAKTYKGDPICKSPRACIRRKSPQMPRSCKGGYFRPREFRFGDLMTGKVPMDHMSAARW